jgi:hypothetical protein
MAAVTFIFLSVRCLHLVIYARLRAVPTGVSVPSRSGLLVGRVEK